MRRTLILLTALSLLATTSAVNARPAAPQTEEGTVVLPGPSPNAGEGCWQGWARRFYIFSQGATSGPLGSVIEIDKKTWGGKFVLDVKSGGTGSEDIDVHFFIDMGSLDPNDPAMQTVAQSSSYQTAKAGGEKGVIPPQTKHAIICLVPGSGYEAAWTYKGTPPKKKK